jgi:hypothetical protein
MKYLVHKKVTKTFSSNLSVSLEKYKELLLEHINFKDGYFKIIEKNNKEQLCIVSSSDYDDQYLVLFVMQKPQQYKAYFLDTQDISLRHNPYVIQALKNNSDYSIVPVEEENLKFVNINYDLQTRRENLIATYDVPGGSVPFYVHKTY